MIHLIKLSLLGSNTTKNNVLFFMHSTRSNNNLTVKLSIFISWWYYTNKNSNNKGYTGYCTCSLNLNQKFCSDISFVHRRSTNQVESFVRTPDNVCSLCWTPIHSRRYFPLFQSVMHQNYIFSLLVPKSKNWQ